jgi:hypothetical protein
MIKQRKTQILNPTKLNQNRKKKKYKITNMIKKRIKKRRKKRVKKSMKKKVIDR